MNLLYRLDILLVAVGIILLSLDDKFKSKFQFILPLAASYQLLRFISLDNHFETSFYFHFVATSFQWTVAIVFYCLNRKQIPAVSILLGSILNMMAVFSNSLKMPVAWINSSGVMPAGYTLMTRATHFNFIGGWITLPHLDLIFSIGDIFILTGILSIFPYYAWFKFCQKTV